MQKNQAVFNNILTSLQTIFRLYLPQCSYIKFERVQCIIADLH